MMTTLIEHEVPAAKMLEEITYDEWDADRRSKWPCALHGVWESWFNDDCVASFEDDECWVVDPDIH